MKIVYTGYDGSKVGIGDRVELHPGLDLWMRGARFGTIRGWSKRPDATFRVRVDATGKVVHLPADRVRIAK